MATSLMQIFAQAYGLDTNDIAELFECSERTARAKLAATPEKDIPVIYEIAEKLEVARQKWQELLVTEVRAQADASDTPLLFMTQSFASNADFRAAVEKEMGVDTSTGVAPLAAVYNAAAFRASVELQAEGIILMTMAYDANDPRSVGFGMSILSQPANK